MTPSPPRKSGRPLIAYVVAGAMAVALFIVGGLNTGTTWGAACIGAGLLSAAVVGVSAALRSWLGAVYGVAIVGAVGLVVAGAAESAVVVVALGVLAMIIVAASAPIAYIIETRAGDATASPTGATALGAEATELLRRIHEHSMLSDNAKRVLFRERELGLLRDAIEVDIRDGEYNAALALCQEMAEVFGYREEAEAFRLRIEQARREHYEMDVVRALDGLGGLLAARDWPRVHQEAARIRRLYGESHLVQDLDQRVHQAREEHKAELEHRFLREAERDNVDAAMALLKQLDRYLSEEEGERLREVAHGVVSRHRENLGVQFKLAVNDRRWAQAAGIGEVIINEFPNTKMADEVRSMIDLLRTRATQAAVADY